jgi:hypothetical protein
MSIPSSFITVIALELTSVAGNVPAEKTLFLLLND